MKLVRHVRTVAATLAAATLALPVDALEIGQLDTFEDGTTQNWVVAPLGAPHPAPPVNQPDGGPLGAGDNYLLMTSVGGSGPGSRLVVINAAQWAGDYLATGIDAITMNVNNLSNSDLHLRLLFEDPTVGPPSNQAITGAILVSAGSGWTTISFDIDPGSLIVLLGDVNTLLANTTAVHIFHGPDPEIPPQAVAAQLGVDNIEAQASVPIQASTWSRIKSAFK